MLHLPTRHTHPDGGRTSASAVSAEPETGVVQLMPVRNGWDFSEQECCFSAVGAATARHGRPSLRPDGNRALDMPETAFFWLADPYNQAATVAPMI